MTVAALSRSEIDTLLREAGAGVLSLSDRGESYAIPESFGYDGDVLYFQSVSGPDSHKRAFMETTDVATLTVFTEHPARSVVVRGPLESVPEEDVVDARKAIAANATIPSLDVDPGTDGRQFALHRLPPDEITGRAFGTAVTVDG